MTCLLTALLCWLAPSAHAAPTSTPGAHATTPPPADRLWYSNATFARLNPLGFMDQAKLGWRHRLSSSDSMLLSDTYTFVGAAVFATPAWSRVGVYGEVLPLAVLRLFTDISAVGYYGTFDQVLSWPDDTAPFSDQTIEAEGDRASGTLGWVLTFGGTLQAKVGPVAARSTPVFTRFSLDLPDGDAFFYDQYFDRLAPNGGWMMLADTDTMLVLEHARIGVRWTYSDNLDGSGNSPTSDGQMAQNRVGPLFAWQFWDKDPGTRFNQPTVFVITQWWLQHPYRTGAEQPQALPLIAAGFAFNGDLKISTR